MYKVDRSASHDYPSCSFSCLGLCFLRRSSPFVFLYVSMTIAVPGAKISIRVLVAWNTRSFDSQDCRVYCGISLFFRLQPPGSLQVPGIDSCRSISLIGDGVALCFYPCRTAKRMMPSSQALTRLPPLASRCLGSRFRREWYHGTAQRSGPMHPCAGRPIPQ